MMPDQGMHQTWHRSSGEIPSLHLSWQELCRGQGALKSSPVAQEGLKSRECSPLKASGMVLA